jgi:hypothetical protein
MFTKETIIATSRRCSDFLEQCPMAYLSVMRMRYRGSPNHNRIVSPRTDIVIEGFPRCANSFAVRAFRLNNDPGHKLRIATHMHSPAQAVMGVRWKIPTLVLIRHPDEAVVSFPALAIQLNKYELCSAPAKFWISQIKYWTRRYTEFYGCLHPIREQIVLADFPETTSNFGSVIQRVNQRFKTNFIQFEHSLKNVRDIFAHSQQHLSPSVERNKIKQTLKNIYHSPENAVERINAINMYERFLLI